MSRAKAKTIAQAVARSSMGRFFSSEVRYGTRLYQRLSYVEWCEHSQDHHEYYRTLTALRRFGSVREAVIRGEWSWE